MYDLSFISFLDSTPDSMVVVNSAGLITLVNMHSEELFGYTRGELKGKKVEMLMPREYREKHIVQRNGFINDPNARPTGTQLPFFGLHKNGAEFPLDISLSTVELEDGIHAVATIWDISERKRTEEELKALNMRLEESNRELESFSYTVSHDLRSPLRHIIGFGKILAGKYSGNLGQDGTEILGKLTESAGRMNMLIDELLAFSHLCGSEFKKQPVNIKKMVEQIIAEAKHVNGNKKIEWHIDEFPEILADKILLNSVLENLISNASKYSSKRDEPRIDIRDKSTDNKELIFSIKDNGAGFDNKYKDKLYGVFHRLHRPDEFEGIGIGLAIVKRIVNRHGGRIWADGAVDKGAEFSFSIPK